MEATFKPLGVRDIDIVTTMMQEFYAIDGYPIDIALSRSLFERFIADEKLGRAWLIGSGEETWGYVILTFVFSFEYKGIIAFLDELYISPTMQGHGLGKAALDFIKAEVKQAGIKIIYLEVEGHNEAAHNLYISKGFALHNRQLMKYSVPK